MVRDRADARWLPSRHHYALFRLFAYLRLRSAKPQPVRGLLLMIDRDQSAMENHTIALWVFFMTIAYLTAELGLLIALPLTWLVVLLPLYVVGPLTNRRRAVSIAYMVLFTAAALYYARADTWIRFVAWQFLGILALNAIAAVILFALRNRIAKLEASVCAA